MAQSTGTFDRYDLSTNGDTAREDLSDVIYNISPTETPFQANAGRATASNTLHEWQTDALATAITSNAHVDGDEFSGDTLNDPERIGNYCQIARKDIVVTRRADRVNKAGMKSALAYQIAKAGKELKRDVEAQLMGVDVASPGDSSTAPTSAGLVSWLKTNTDRGQSGTDPALSSTTYGYPDTAAGNGTDRALSEATLLGIIEDCYTQGGNPDTIMVSPTVKQRISNYMYGSSARIATPYQDHGKTPGDGARVVGAVDYYVSDFGVLHIVPNRFQRDDDVFVLDMEYFSVAYLDGYKTEKVAKVGDAERRMLLVDYTLCSKNEAASGIFADCDESLAMTA